MIQIDGTTYNVPLLPINRKIDFLDKSAFRTENGVLYREILGVFENYDFQTGGSINNVNDYLSLIDKLSEPVEFHDVLVPGYNGNKTYEAYIANIKDEVHRWVNNGVTYYTKLTFSVIARSPTRIP
jgi:hypothetical protein